MAEYGYERNTTPDRVQNVEVQGVQGSGQVRFSSEGRGRLLDLKAMRTHNVHIQNIREGRENPGANCQICGDGLGSIMEEPQEEYQPGEHEMVTRNRADQEKAAARTRSDGTNGGEDRLLWE